MSQDEKKASAAAEPTNTPSAAPEGTRPPRRRRAVHWLLGTLALLLVLAIGIAGLVAWSLRSESGTAFVLQQIPGLTIEGGRGSLLGDYSADSLSYTVPGSGAQVKLNKPSWRGLRVSRGSDGAWLRLQIDELVAERIDWVDGKPQPDEPLRKPENLRLPFELQIDQLKVGEVHAAALGERPVRDLRGKIHLGAERGTEHRLEDLRLNWDRLAASGSLRIGADGDMPLKARLAVQPRPAEAAAGAAGSAATPSPLDSLLGSLDWHAEASLDGPLAAPRLKAGLRTTDAASAAAQAVAAAGSASAASAGAGQSLDAEGLLRPFEPWPLGDFRAEVRSLDLSTLHSAAPKTGLSGSALAVTRGLDQPADVRLTLANSAPGRWDEGRLPLRSIELEARGRPDQPQTVELRRFEAQLGSAARPAGRIEGQGQLSPERWSVDLLLSELQPARLDARAAEMRLAGNIKLRGNLPAAAAANSATAASAPSRSASAPAAAPAQPMVVDAKAELSGTLAANGRGAPKVQLVLDAGLRSAADGALKIDLRRVDATAGGSRATVEGAVERASARAPWQVRVDAGLAEFDPTTWWPGAPVGWQQGRHRLNADAKVAVAVAQPAPARAGASPGLGTQLAAVSGESLLTIRPSTLASVPLQGTLQLRSAGGSLRSELALNAAGNRIQADGALDLASLGSSTAPKVRDQWNLALDAPELSRLAPLLRLMPDAGPAAPIGGAVAGKVQVDGRWPSLRSSGNLDAIALRAPDLRVDKASARWQIGTVGDAPTNLQAELSGATVGTTPVEALRLELSGTARNHRLELTGRSGPLPTAVTDALQAASGRPAGSSAGAVKVAAAGPRRPSAERAELALQLQGGLIEGRDGGATAATLGATGWRGTLQRAEVRSITTPATPWLRIGEVGAEVRWVDGPLRAQVQPGRAELRVGATAAALRWQRIAWQAETPAGTGRPGAPGTSAAAPARLDAEAELEPLQIAPILALLQPDFGWAGDLAVTGRLAVRSAPTVRIDAVLERQRGDLQVSDEAGNTRRLGLTDLRLGLEANNGVWNFTQALAGSTIGVAAGAIVARTSPTVLWPGPQTPVQGVVELNVADLGTWGPWVPTGWRLGGKLQVSAGISGRFGAPELTGSLTGSGLTVRNFLEGVNVRDGEVAIALQGTTARIERFTARAGDGQVVLTGNAALGDSPQARLQLKADRFQLLGRVDRRIVASGSATLRMDPKRLAVDGSFKVDEGLVDFSRGDAPTLSSDVVVLRTARDEAARRAAPDPSRPPGSAGKPAGSAAKAAAAKRDPQRQVALNIGIDLGDELRLRGRGIDTGLAGQLRITSPAGEPLLHGTIRTVGGTYNAYGQKLVIDRGQIIFGGEIGNPRLDILATRANSDVRVGVTVTGQAQNPRVRLYSEPEMSETDKLSWLVLGRSSDTLGRTDTALLQRAALALVSGEGEGKGDQLTRKLGLDELSFRQRDAGDVSSTVLSLGKQLSSRWYIGYEQGLNNAVGGFQLIYRIAQRFTLRAQTGTDNSIDLTWSLRSRRPPVAASTPASAPAQR